MAKYISQVDMSLTQDDEQLLTQKGFTKISVDLNKGVGGKHIYIWYKHGSVPITGLQVTFNDDMTAGLKDAGYTEVPKTQGDDFIHLWYFRGSREYNTPIVDIDVTANAESEAMKFKNDWERMACDLDRFVGGNWIHAWVKREKKTYICDVTATDIYRSDSDYFKKGYIRVDENTNRGTGGSPVFIWYRQTTDILSAIHDLKISTSDQEYKELQEKYYIPLSVNLNEATGGKPVHLFHKKDQQSTPIKFLSLVLNTAAVPVYEEAGVTVIKKSLNAGNGGSTEYVCFRR